MGKPGMTVSRWIDGVLEKNELIDQDSNLRGLIFWGHAPNSQTRGLEMKTAMDKLDLMVVIDPYPSASAAMAAMPARPASSTRTAPSTCCRRRRSSRPRAR
jgi:formate dehydrogenase major subunit